MLDDIEQDYLLLEKLKTPVKIDGNLSIRLSFDRKRLSIILSDGISSVELSKKQFEMLQNYEMN